MEFSKELLTKLKECKNEEDVKRLAKENNITINEDDLSKAMTYVNKEVLSEEELSSVVGGKGCSTSTKGSPKYQVGQYLYVYRTKTLHGITLNDGKYIVLILENLGLKGKVFPEYKYKVRFLNGMGEEEIWEDTLYED